MSYQDELGRSPAIISMNCDFCDAKGQVIEIPVPAEEGTYHISSVYICRNCLLTLLALF